MLPKILISTILLSICNCLSSQTKDSFSEMLFRVGSNSKDFDPNNLKELTTPPDIKKEIYLGKYFEVQGPSNPKQKYIYAGRVKTCRAGGCSIDMDSRKDKESEFFDYYIIFDSTIAIQKIKIYSYQATHGHEVSSKGWLKQFIGYDGTKELIVNKNVDAISGATISVHAITYDITHKTDLLRIILHR